MTHIDAQGKAFFLTVLKKKCSKQMGFEQISLFPCPAGAAGSDCSVPVTQIPDLGQMGYCWVLLSHHLSGPNRALHMERK